MNKKSSKAVAILQFIVGSLLAMIVALIGLFSYTFITSNGEDPPETPATTLIVQTD